MSRVDIYAMLAHQLALRSPLHKGSSLYESASIGGIDVSSVGIDVDGIRHLHAIDVLEHSAREIFCHAFSTVRLHHEGWVDYDVIEFVFVCNVRVT